MLPSDIAKWYWGFAEVLQLLHWTWTPESETEKKKWFMQHWVILQIILHCAYKNRDSEWQVEVHTEAQDNVSSDSEAGTAAAPDPFINLSVSLECQYAFFYFTRKTAENTFA